MNGLNPSRTSHFVPVYAQGDPGQGIGGYDLIRPADQAFAFDYDSSGKLDHLVLYRPGTGAIFILKNTGVLFSPVYAQGDPGQGIGGYDLIRPADQAFAFDYDSSGKLDHLVLYRPGTGAIFILKNMAGQFTPVYAQGDPGQGIGGYDLIRPADQAFAFDYDSSGKLDHLVLYRPGTGAIFILKNTGGQFSPVYAQGDPGQGIGGYDLIRPADRAFAFDYDSSGKLDHLVLYRPGTGAIFILKNTGGQFSPVYAQGDPGQGIGGYDLIRPADQAFAFDYDSSGKLDHLVLYRPGTGAIFILKNTEGQFTPVYAQGDPGQGIGGYDLKSPADRAFAFDYDSSGKLDHLVLYRPGTGAIFILSNTITLQPLVYITDSPPQHDSSSATWASQVCQNQQFLRNEAPVWEWTPVLTPTDESGQLGDSVGISGWAINPHLSGADLVFTHPFGPDWEFFIAPDPQYLTLLAPNNLLTGVSDSDTQEYRDATARANDPNGLNLGIPGVLGVEVDGAFVPGDYQAQHGNRVAVFGRWIVDCGHPDFHTEIHPPLLLAVARPMGTGTSVKVISRPFLVSQEFGDGALRQHLDKEIAKVEGLASLQLEVHARLISPPFSGLHIMRFFVGPLTPRRSPNDQLLLSCHFTVRSGVAVEVTRGVNPDEVQVLVAMNDVSYSPAPLPSKHSVSKQIADLGADALGPGIGIGILNQIFNPVANLILARGILIDLYDPPRPQSAHDSENVVTNVVVDQNMRVLNPVSVGDDQPFPIYGWLTLQWG